MPLERLRRLSSEHPDGHKCLWSDSDGFRRAGGGRPPNTAPARYGGELAPAVFVPAARVGATSAARLDALGVSVGLSAPTATFARGRDTPALWDAQERLDDLTAALRADKV